MPWCSECDRFLSPPTVKTGGTCPSCGSTIDAPSPGPAATAGTAAEDEAVPFPWHLKLLAGAVALYLGFRAWQGVEWLIHLF